MRARRAAAGTGAAGGDGGLASATATLTTSVATAGTTMATATGGNGGAASSGAAGGAGAAADAAATTTDGPGAASATADATGGNSALSLSGNGVDGATAAANAAATGISATVQAATVGGDGGGATGVGNTGGNGASLLGTATVNDSAVATATASSGAASAEADATGGNGGAGSGGASGGAGGDASLTNAVVAASSGTVALIQTVTGGSGGSSTAGTGVGGSATSTLNDTPTSNQMTADISATGGVGGTGVAGAAGGAAIATLDTTTAGTLMSGSDVIAQSATAVGGNGGSSAGAVGGAGGDANASDTATASGGIGAFSVKAMAVAGAGGSGSSIGANGAATANALANTEASAVSALSPATAFAQATALALAGGGSTTLGNGTATATAETANGLLAEGYAETTGGAGTANGSATTSGGLILKLTAAASAPTDGKSFADATAENGATASGAPSDGDNAYAAAGGLVKYSGLGTNVGAAFNNPAAVLFGTGSLGALYSPTASGGQIYTSSISWDVNSAILPVGGTLDLGLVSPVGGTGTLTSITFELTEDGVIVVPETTFSSAGEADLFFTDNLMNLGAAAAGVTGDLNVTATMSETLSGSGDGYGFDFMVGVVPCFAAGTRILTERGEVRVERLRVGDRAVSAFGGSCEIVWIGHREVNCTRHPAPSEVWPVRILPGAFGPGLPERELWLSPDHAVLVGGVLIPVKYLVNETTVMQEAVARVVYWHVECAQHEVLLAEGLPAESYLDTGNRGAFVEAGVISLHAGFGIEAREVWAQFGCRPLVEAGPALDAARAYLAGCAAAMGFAPVTFHRVELDQVGLVQVVVPAGIARVHLVSACRVPAGERRRLGAAIGAISLDGVVVSLGDAGLESGFHAIERGAGGAYRWTNGEGVLRFAASGQARDLAVRVRMLVVSPDEERRIA